MDSVRRNNWSAGSNNIAQPHRLPEGYARRLVNLEPADGGTLELRPRFVKELDLTAPRALFALENRLVFAQGDSLWSHNTSTGQRSRIAIIAAAGDVAGAELNGRLHVRTLEDRLTFDGRVVSAWGADNPVLELRVVPGALPAGVYKVAATVEAGGHESGADVMILSLPEGSGIHVRSASGESVSIYQSVANGATLYHVGDTREVLLTAPPAANTRQLTTGGMIPMPIVSAMAAVGSMLVGCHGSYLYNTDPMRPHLVDRVKGFAQFPSAITLLAPVGTTGLFVATEHATYFMQGVGTDQVSMRAIAEFGATAGTAVALPDKTVAWFSPYGQVIGFPDGSLNQLNEGKYAPRQASAGAAGYIEHNGTKRVVTSLRESRPNSLAVGDSWSIEVTDERA